MEGFRANRFSKSVFFRPMLALFEERELSAPLTESWQIQIGEQQSGCCCSKENGLFFVIGPEIELPQLLDFAGKKVVFFYRGREFELSPIARLA